MIYVAIALAILIAFGLYVYWFLKVYQEEVDTIARSGLSTVPLTEVNLSLAAIRKRLRQTYTNRYQYYRDSGNKIFIRMMPKRGNKGGLFVIEMNPVDQSRTSLGIGGRLIGHTEEKPSEEDFQAFAEFIQNRLDTGKVPWPTLNHNTGS